jgi:nickel-dependent lactate racemase
MCWSGIGEEAYFSVLASSKTLQETLTRIEQGCKLGYHKAVKMAEIATWAEIWVVTGLAEQDMEQAFIRPFHEVQEALDKAIEKKGEKAKILFLMDASLTVSKIMG